MQLTEAQLNHLKQNPALLARLKQLIDMQAKFDTPTHVCVQCYVGPQNWHGVCFACLEAGEL